VEAVVPRDLQIQEEDLVEVPVLVLKVEEEVVRRKQMRLVERRVQREELK
jgi:hypothetical protein